VRRPVVLRHGLQHLLDGVEGAPEAGGFEELEEFAGEGRLADGGEVSEGAAEDAGGPELDGVFHGW